MAVIVGILALVGALYALGQWGDDPEQEARRPAASTPEPAAPAEEKKERKRKRAPARPKRVRLQIQPTGPVSVCLEDAAGKALIANVTLAANQDTETFRTTKRLRVSFGTGAAVMRIDGKAYQVADDAPIGYEIRPGRKPRTLPEDERPTCDG
jgi:hypothetical protein